MHPQIIEIIKTFAQNPSIKVISLTTNGYNLDKLAKPLKAAGLTNLNIGCDSLCNYPPRTRSKTI